MPELRAVIAWFWRPVPFQSMFSERELTVSAISKPIWLPLHMVLRTFTNSTVPLIKRACVATGKCAAFVRNHTAFLVAVDETPSNKSLDASGGSVFLNLLGATKGALIRAAASTQPL